MSMFEELMLAKNISFNEGKIELLKQQVVMLPAEFMSDYTSEINNDPNKIKEIYQAGKEAIKNNFGPGIGKHYSFNFSDFFRWYISLAKLSGWGIVKWAEFDKNSYSGVITIEDSLVGTNLKNKVTSPCDHIIRGLMAGSATSAFLIDVDMIETECIALGSEKCKFLMGKYDYLKSKFPDIVTNCID